MHCWLLFRDFSSLPGGPFRGSVSSMAACYCRVSDEREKERDEGELARERENSRQNTTFFYNLILEMTKHHFCNILWLTQADPGTNGRV